MNSFENTKVLMALNALEIGGAETHVLELCKALKQRGLDIYVVSNGGVYEHELIRHGIKHFKLPLHNKKLSNLISSYSSLRRIILENDIRLVHAHARIPAFLCGKLQKKLGFTFVTTTHLNFNTAVHYKIFSNWGDATLAVSQDICEYLVDNYKMPKESIIVSVNGINTQSFNNNVDFCDIAAELDLSPDKKRIVFLSRLEKNVTGPIHCLMEIAEHIHFKNENTEIIIVGDGGDYIAIKEKADEINERLGKNYIKMVGGRTDVAKFLAASDIFVGVSRSVLEAMACAKPVILAGWQGYLGIFDQNTIGDAMGTNFTCRGQAEVTAEKLRDDIFRLLNASPDKLRELGDFGKKTVEESYSLDKMADDTLRLYTSVRKSPRPIDALISGYHGSNNHGDDAILQAITEDLRKIRPDINISVISKRPKETRSTYRVNAIHRLNFLRIRRALKETNLLIMGGGTLIQDLTSTRSLKYYLFVMNSAVKARAKIMLYANGIGPLRLEKNKQVAVTALEKVEKITLRDERSRIVLQELGLKNDNILVTADPAFRFKNANPAAAEPLLDKIQLLGKKYFCVSIRSWKGLKEDFVTEIAVFCDYMSEKHDMHPLFIPMQPSNDAEISTQVMEAAKRRSYYLNEDFTIDEILSVVGGAQFLVGMRLHSVIYGARAATPVLGLVYDPKVSAMFTDLNQRHYLMLREISSGRLIDFAEEILANREKISEQLVEITKPMEDKARQNANIAYDIIERDLF